MDRRLFWYVCVKTPSLALSSLNGLRIFWVLDVELYY